MKLLYLPFVLFINLSFGQKSAVKSDDKDYKPVEIKATDVDNYIAIAPPVEESDYDVPFSVVEKIPMFVNCEDINNQENKKCFDEKIKEHIAKNLKCSNKDNLDTNIRVIVVFTIKSDGSIANIKTRCRNNSNCDAFEQEAIRVIKLLPNFKPATQRGKSVNVSYAVPIIFNQKAE